MRRTMEGYLSCPLEGDGDSELELSEMNAEMATGLEGPIYREPGSGLGDDL